MKRSGLKTKTENNHGRTNAYANAYTVANTNTYADASAHTDADADAYADAYAYTRADADAYAHTHAYADTDASWRRADNSCCGGRSGRTAANANAHTRTDRDKRGRLRDEGDDRLGDREGR